MGGDKSVRSYLKVREVYISIITEIELLSIPFYDEQSEILIQDFISSCGVLDIDNRVKVMAAKIRRIWKAKLPDAIIAATAIENNLEFYTADRGFSRIKTSEFNLTFFK